MPQSIREKVALIFSTAVITGAIWFWSLQLGDVLETLKLAAG